MDFFHFELLTTYVFNYNHLVQFRFILKTAIFIILQKFSALKILDYMVCFPLPDYVVMVCITLM